LKKARQKKKGCGLLPYDAQNAVAPPSKKTDEKYRTKLLSHVRPQREALEIMKQNDLYQRMTRISERYLILKSLFDQFTKFATSQLTNDKYPVKGITFLPRLNRNFFDVCFAGRRIRFFFTIAEDATGYFQGIVTCNSIGMDGKPCGDSIGKFSFNRHGETRLKTDDDDSISIDSEHQAGYIVLIFLNIIFDQESDRTN